MTNRLRHALFYRSWNVWFGTSFRFHPLFTLLLILSILTGYAAELLTLFGVVLVHELGHVAAARSLGWRVREVRLLPFGGVAVVEEAPGATAVHELAVALAGPLQNVWMMAVGYGLIWSGLLPPLWGEYFIQANAMIALFNLLPILPLDGGKVMTVLFGLWLPYQRTLQLAAGVSLLFSALLLAAALFHAWTERGGVQLNWLLIGCFLFASNWYERRGAPYRFMRFLLNREGKFAGEIAQGTLACPIVVHGHRKAGEIVRLFMRDRYHLVYVLDERSRIRHIIPEKQLLDCYFDGRKRERTVAELFA
ncbi:stage IV sporulation protein FB [Paenibacillus sp. UNCCL117]|uniref:M50 family metallopeptidase n=1 Tax=unclassified Paenibacillus TaxID=185978 RepID=UPI00088DC5AC|nr:MULTISPECIES: M50 family metallopeptidase [unclassified Paenibacillus]SDD23763.1 stage IV sporulation protein FB [Paenibacillus sp. cl123]SFW41619.1 stage IV sporulation protein FB [Paenibacillus sp. UNCCL117]